MNSSTPFTNAHGTGEAPAHKALATVLVTGGCGYLGSQLIRELATVSSREKSGGGGVVRVMDNLDSGSEQALMGLPATARFEFVEEDILNRAALEVLLPEVDVVVHLAAIVHTPMGYENPTWVEQVNHWGTSQLVEACLESGVRRFVYASSVAVYGPTAAARPPATEAEACRPVGPYAQSKHRAEHAVRTAVARGLDATVLRFGVLYGTAPVVRFDAVANRFAYLAGVRRALTIHGSGQQQRAFTHVRDAAAAIRLVLREPETVGHTYNVVGENASVLDLVEAIRTLDAAVETRRTHQDVQTDFNIVASPEALMRLGWAPTMTLTSGLAELYRRFDHFQPLAYASAARR